MGWVITEDVGRFLAEADGFLRAGLAENTILLSVAANVQAGAGTAVLFGWWRDGTQVTGAFADNPPYPLVLSGMPPQAARALAIDLAGIGRAVTGVSAPPPEAAAFAAGWREASGCGSRVTRQMRLHRLAGLIPPAPPPGRPRTAGPGDRDLLLEWQIAFRREVHEPPDPRPHEVDDRLGYGGLTLWEAGGGAVSMAGVSRAVAGLVRVGPVYTPPEHRGLGYAGAVTAAVSRAALEAGAREVVLFTDLGNPTSNALYRRLGYQPVSDRSVLSFAPPGPGPA
ncbi:MAG TPA: GNAT family N-acetyltransferase [Streptosporangiaceae bacterium]